MGQEIPFWLDELFLTTVLERGKMSGPRVNILDFSVRSAGSNFTSHPYRVWVQYEVGSSPKKKTTSIIVKVPDKRMLNFGKPQQIRMFRKEPMVYRDILPEMNKLLNCEFGAKPLYSPVKNGTVLTDLKQLGYVVCDESNQLDVAHCMKTIEAIAKFHASSVACHRDRKELIETVGEEVLWHEGGILRPEMVKSAVETVLNILIDLGGCERFVDYLSQKVDSIWESVVKVLSPKEKGLNVLNHGDLWCNNIMFKYDHAKNIEDVKLIDFQTVKFTSPALDLVNFIWTSADEEARGRKQRQLLHIYLITLNDTLQQLGCEETLSEQEFLEDLQNAKDWGVLMICCALPVIVSTSERLCNLEEVEVDDFASWFKGIFKGERLKVMLPSVVDNFTDIFLQEKITLY